MCDTIPQFIYDQSEFNSSSETILITESQAGTNKHLKGAARLCDLSLRGSTPYAVMLYPTDNRQKGQRTT